MLAFPPDTRLVEMKTVLGSVVIAGVCLLLFVLKAMDRMAMSIGLLYAVGAGMFLPVLAIPLRFARLELAILDGVLTRRFMLSGITLMANQAKLSDIADVVIPNDTLCQALNSEQEPLMAFEFSARSNTEQCADLLRKLISEQVDG